MEIDLKDMLKLTPTGLSVSLRPKCEVNEYINETIKSKKQIKQKAYEIHIFTGLYGPMQLWVWEGSMQDGLFDFICENKRIMALDIDTKLKIK